MGLKRIGRLASTLRYLTAEQVIYRLYYRARSLRVEQVTDASLRSSMRWAAPGFIQLSTSDGIEFSFLGAKGRIDDSGWNAAQHSKLWLYNLHYLDDLNAVGIDEQNALACVLVNRWIEANPAPSGNGWEPYPLSLRIVNLVKWFARQEALEPHWLVSLATQMQALAKQVEYHILGNHLFANGKALVFGGSYLAGPDAERWLAKGLKILDREIEEQFLEDGAHFELSPMYHSTLLWDMCDLVNLADRVDLPELKARLPQWRMVVTRGLRWLRSMLHPDGGISFFNDAAFGIAPVLSDLEAYACKLSGCLPVAESNSGAAFALAHHAQSGYAAVTLGDGHKALLDLAKVGPDYQPGHGHADTLSFELSLFRQRIFVNSGTSQYGEDAERHRQRSTAAHNTVEVAGENSSEMWAGFRVARRAFPVLEALAADAEQIYVRAYHTGYRRLKGKNLHRREWLFRANGCQVIDEVTGAHGNAVARLHVHPDVVFAWSGGELVAVLSEGQQIRLVIEGASSVTLQPSSWHPAFGSTIPCQCIVAEFSSGKLVTLISWSDSV
jgi:uncharacterized heparinase superfamily protein